MHLVTNAAIEYFVLFGSAFVKMETWKHQALGHEDSLRMVNFPNVLNDDFDKNGQAALLAKRALWKQRRGMRVCLHAYSYLNSFLQKSKICEQLFWKEGYVFSDHCRRVTFTNFELKSFLHRKSVFMGCRRQQQNIFGMRLTCHDSSR